MEEEVKKTIRRWKGGDRKQFSINVLELMGTVMTAYVMIVSSKDRLAQERESVLMRWDSSSVMQCVINCEGGRERRYWEGK